MFRNYIQIFRTLVKLFKLKKKTPPKPPTQLSFMLLVQDGQTDRQAHINWSYFNNYQAFVLLSINFHKQNVMSLTHVTMAMNIWIPKWHLNIHHFISVHEYLNNIFSPIISYVRVILHFTMTKGLKNALQWTVAHVCLSQTFKIVFTWS